MKNLLPILALPVSLFLSGQAIGNATPPDTCPSVSSIKSIGLSNAVVMEVDGGWAAVLPNQTYDTSNTWAFVMILKARSKDEAYEKAVEALPSLQFITGPTNFYEDKWFCTYMAAGHKAGTITPFENLNAVKFF